MMPFNPNQPMQQPSGAPAPFNPQGGFPVQQASTPQPLSQTPADMQFLDIDLGYDPSADANALLPPVLPTEYLFGNVTEGYQCVVEFAEADPAKRFMKAETKPSARAGARPYIFVELMLVIQNCTKNPAMNGRRIPYRAMTLTSEGMKTNGMQALIQATSKAQELNTLPRTPMTLLKLITEIVNSKTVLTSIVDWEASFYDKEQGKDIAPRIRGWRNFLNPQTGAINEEITIHVNTPLGPKQETRKPRPTVRFITYGTQAPRQAVNLASFQQSAAFAPSAQPVAQPVSAPQAPLGNAPAPQAPQAQGSFNFGSTTELVTQPVAQQPITQTQPQQPPAFAPPAAPQPPQAFAPQQPTTAAAPNLAALFG